MITIAANACLRGPLEDQLAWSLANVFRAFSHGKCLPCIKSDIGAVSVPSHERNRIQINFQVGFLDVGEPFPCRHV